MENLNEMLDETEDGFEDLDTLFPSTNKEETVEEDDEPPVEKPKAKRGRKKKEPAEEAPKEEEEKPKSKRGRKKKEESSAEEKPCSSEDDLKGVDVSDLPIEVIDQILHMYSREPVKKIAKRFSVTPEQVEKSIKVLSEYFQLAVSTGDISMEQFEEKISPKLKPYDSSLSNFQVFVKSEIERINHEIDEED